MSVKKLNPHEWFLGFQVWLGKQSDYRSLLALIPVRAKDLRDRTALMRGHHQAMAATLMDERLSRKFAEAIDAYQTEILQAPPVSSADTEEVNQAFANLQRDGFAVLPPLPNKTVEEMRDWVAQQPVKREPVKGRPAGVLAVEEARQIQNIGRLENHTAVRCPNLLALATDPLRLGIAARWCGTTPTILLTGVWRSFAGKTAAKDEQLFHLDLDDHRFCKFFVYLTDVGEDDGPHVLIPGSHTPQALAAAVDAADDPEACRNWLRHNLRKTDDEVRQYFRTEPVSLTGPAGTNFIAATRGVHKGLMPIRSDRLVCQVVYGATSFLQIPNNPQPVGSDAAGALPAALAEPPLDFTTRFMVKKA